MATRKTPVLQGLYTHTPYVSSLAVDRTRYPADKEASWSLDSDLMALRLMHNALRAESTKFEAVLFALGDRKLEPSEVQLIKDWWSTHVQHFTSYRAMEVDKLAPFIETKARPGDVLSEKHHQSLFGVLQIVNAAVTDCAYDENSSNTLTASAIASTVHGYRTVLYAHLAETEKVIVPVLRSYFSPEEVFSIFADILSQMPKLAFGSLAHHLTGGDDGVTAFNARSLVTPRWRFTSSDTIKARAEYRVKVESKLESLLSGDGNIKM